MFTPLSRGSHQLHYPNIREQVAAEGLGRRFQKTTLFYSAASVLCRAVLTETASSTSLRRGSVVYEVEPEF